MTKVLMWLLLVAFLPLPVWAQPPPPGSAAELLYEPPPTDRHRSPVLAILGVTLLGGGAVVLGASLASTPGDDYLVNGQLYCVDVERDVRHYDFRRGACGTVPGVPEARPYAYAMMGAGALMTFLGLQKVPLRPMLAPGVVGASAVLRW
jgi:hypothetical protein